MECPECGHIFSKHDDFGCLNGSCDCARSTAELMGTLTLPQLPKGLRFSKYGYTKEYGIEPEDLFEGMLKVISQLAHPRDFKIKQYHRIHATIRIATGLNPDDIKKEIPGYLEVGSLIEARIEVRGAKEQGQNRSELVMNFHFTMLNPHREADIGVAFRFDRASERILFHLYAARMTQLLDATRA